MILIIMFTYLCNLHTVLPFFCFTQHIKNILSFCFAPYSNHRWVCVRGKEKAQTPWSVWTLDWLQLVIFYSYQSLQERLGLGQLLHILTTLKMRNKYAHISGRYVVCLRLTKEMNLFNILNKFFYMCPSKFTSIINMSKRKLKILYPKLSKTKRSSTDGGVSTNEMTCCM